MSKRKARWYRKNQQENNLCKFCAFSLLLAFHLSACEFTPFQMPSEEDTTPNGSQAGSQQAGSQMPSEGDTTPNGLQAGSQNSQVGDSRLLASDDGSQSPVSEDTTATEAGDTEVPSAQKQPVAQCTQDSDCVLVDEGCCGCRSGGRMIAIHSSQQAEHKSNLQRKCSEGGGMCLGQYLCGEYTKQCLNSTCQAIRPRSKVLR